MKYEHLFYEKWNPKNDRQSTVCLLWQCSRDYVCILIYRKSRKQMFFFRTNEIAAFSGRPLF